MYYKTVKRNRLDISHSRDYNIIIHNINHLKAKTPYSRKDILDYLLMLENQINPDKKEFYKDGEEMPNPSFLDHTFFNQIVMRLDEIYLELHANGKADCKN
jgi:hypothetical protein